MKRIITFGTFDLFHIGHLRILQRSKDMGDYLIVGVSTDALNMKKKGAYPAYSEEERVEIVRNIRCVDEVFLEESLEQKREYIIRFGADLLVMGDDWKGKFDEFGDICEVAYLERTPNISTTQVKTEIFHRLKDA
jgi:glycerol-3-phosphate cytidylyltransferase